MTIRATTIGALLLTLAACSDGPTAYELLSPSRMNADAAVDVVTTGQDTVPPNCGATSTLNCPNGVPGTTPALIALSRTAVTVDSVNDTTYSFSATVGITTPTAIPVQLPIVGACTLNIDTAPGTAATATLSGTVAFTKKIPGAPMDRVRVVVNVAGIENADISLAGGFDCTLTSSFTAFFVSTLQDALTQDNWLCGAPGPALFVRCRD